MTTFYPPVLCRGHSFLEKTIQIVKMLFIFAILKLKAIFKAAAESVPFCNYFDK